MSLNTGKKHDPLQNRLLASLPAEVLARIAPNLKPTHLALGRVIYEPDEALQHVYFPTSAIVSLLYIMENGTSAEMGVVGEQWLSGRAVIAVHHPLVRRAGLK